MELKVKAAQLIEPGSVQVIGTIGDETNALTLVTFRIGIGPAYGWIGVAGNQVRRRRRNDAQDSRVWSRKEA
jgi:hypothetical protein